LVRNAEELDTCKIATALLCCTRRNKVVLGKEARQTKYPGEFLLSSFGDKEIEIIET
jgi:hypothetical protein